MSEPSGESAWRFYARLLAKTPEAIWDAGGHFGTLALFALGILFLVNRHLAKSVSAWEGISPLWAIVPFAALIVLGLLRANHAEFKRVQAERAPQQPIGQYVHQQFVVASPDQAADLLKKVHPVEMKQIPEEPEEDAH